MPDAAPRFRVPMVARILVAMILGGIVGVWLGPRAAGLGKVGEIVLEMVKGLAAPVLFFAILDAFLRTEVRARSGFIMVAISAINAAIAIVVGLTLSNVIRPGDGFAAAMKTDPAAL